MLQLPVGSSAVNTEAAASLTKQTRLAFKCPIMNSEANSNITWSSVHALQLQCMIWFTKLHKTLEVLLSYMLSYMHVSALVRMACRLVIALRLFVFCLLQAKSTISRAQQVNADLCQKEKSQRSRSSALRSPRKPQLVSITALCQCYLQSTSAPLPLPVTMLCFCTSLVSNMMHV